MKRNIFGFFKDNKLLTALYFVFVILLCTTTFVGFSGNVEENAVKVSSITPEYDESSSVVVNNNDVVFNDRDQEVKYKVVLENTESSDLYVSNINQTTPSESFLSYKVENLKKDDAIKGNSKKEIIVSLKTNAVEGWGRNFNDELTANIGFAKKIVSNNQNVGSPDTGDGIVLAVLIAATSATGLVILIVSKNKFVKYMVFVIMLTPALTLVKADTTLELPIKLNVSFESQNVMKLAKNESGAWNDYWDCRSQIKDFYIQNEITSITNFVYEYDVSNAGNGRVKAYLVDSASSSECYDFEGGSIHCYDLYLQADGVIYPNTDASSYFAGMDNLENIHNIEGLDVRNVTNMRGMFEFTGEYSENFILDLGDNFDTSNVTDMSFMFRNTGSYSRNFTLDLGDKFDTSKVIDMSSMFGYTGFGSLNFTLDLGDKFHTSNVTNMREMFYATGFDNSDFTLDLGDKFDTSKVTNMFAMFSGVGINSTKLNISITIKNPDVVDFRYMLDNAVTKEGSKIIINYTSKTSTLVDKMIGTKSGGANVDKGELVEIIIDDIDVGDEIAIADEHFNVISQTDDTVTMLAKYNLGTDYRQSTIQNSMVLSEDFTWRENSNEIDIQSLTSGLKTYVNNYVAYLKDVLGSENVIGDLISLNELNNLDCDVNIEEPSDVNNCLNSQHFGWLGNGQYWYTRIRYPEMYDKVFVVRADSYVNAVSTDNPSGLRPTITISKETLRNLG